MSLSINVSEIAVRSAAENEVVVDHRTMLSEVLLVLSALHTDGVDFFFWNNQTRQIIIPMQFIPKTVVVIVDIFFHCVNLRESFICSSSEWL